MCSCQDCNKREEDLEAKIRNAMAIDRNINLCTTLGGSLTQQLDIIDTVRGNVINRHIVHLWHGKEIN